MQIVRKRNYQLSVTPMYVWCLTPLNNDGVRKQCASFKFLLTKQWVGKRKLLMVQCSKWIFLIATPKTSEKLKSYDRNLKSKPVGSKRVQTRNSHLIVTHRTNLLVPFLGRISFSIFRYMRTRIIRTRYWNDKHALIFTDLFRNVCKRILASKRKQHVILKNFMYTIRIC